MEQNGTEKGYGVRCEDKVIVTRGTDLYLLIYQSFTLFLSTSQSYSFGWETFDKKSHCQKWYKKSKQVLFLCLTSFEQLPLSPASTESKRDRCSSNLPGGKSSAATDQFSLVRWESACQHTAEGQTTACLAHFDKVPQRQGLNCWWDRRGDSWYLNNRTSSWWLK